MVFSSVAFPAKFHIPIVMRFVSFSTNHLLAAYCILCHSPETKRKVKSTSHHHYHDCLLLHLVVMTFILFEWIISKRIGNAIGEREWSMGVVVCLWGEEGNGRARVYLSNVSSFCLMGLHTSYIFHCFSLTLIQQISLVAIP